MKFLNALVLAKGVDGEDICLSLIRYASCICILPHVADALWIIPRYHSQLHVLGKMRISKELEIRIKCNRINKSS